MGIEVRTFVRIQKVIWHQLLPCKAEIIHRWALFWFSCRTPCGKLYRSNYRLVVSCPAVFPFILFCSLPRKFFHLNHEKNVWKRCSHPIFSSQKISLFLFLPKRCFVLCSHFSLAMGDCHFLLHIKQLSKTTKKSNYSGSGFVRFSWIVKEFYFYW